MKPLIGITADFIPDPGNSRTQGLIQLNSNYAQCVSDAGGAPIVIPPQCDVSEIGPSLHGLLIPGGNDIDATNWGEANHPSVRLISPDRFRLESELLDAVDPSLPVLGICYGCQLINVKRGGSLVQHLPDVLGHDENSGGTLQNYEIAPESKLGGIVGGSVLGKSYHHQAVAEAGKGIHVVGRGSDGVVEAIEAVDHPWMIGVQWHPERTFDDEATRKLFREFISAARTYMESSQLG